MTSYAGKPTSFRIARSAERVGRAALLAATPPDTRPAQGAQRVLATVLAGFAGEPGELPQPVLRDVGHSFAGGRCLIGARLDFERTSSGVHGPRAAWCAACAPAVAAAELETGSVAPASAGVDVALLTAGATMRVACEYMKWRTGGGSARGVQQGRSAADSDDVVDDVPYDDASVISAVDMPLRSPVLLARERAGVAALTAQLFGDAMTRADARDAASALSSRDAARRYIGAFLAGRCLPADAAAERTLMLSLEQAATWSPQPDVAIEAAMSLALRGRVARGREALQSLLSSSRPLGDQYKAAFYLAQLGDASGYGALVLALRGPLAHYRLMAMRHALAFLPFNGRSVDGLKVDVEALLAERLTDTEPLVRAEAVPCLVELRAPF